MNPFKWLWRKIFRKKREEFTPKSYVGKHYEADIIPSLTIDSTKKEKDCFCQICESGKPKDILYQDFVGWICSSCSHVICKKCLKSIKDANGPLECSWWGCSSNDDKVEYSAPLRKIKYIFDQGTSEDYNKLKDALAIVTKENSILVKAIDQVVVDHVDEKDLKFSTAVEYENWEKMQFGKLLTSPKNVKIDLYGTLKRKGSKPINDNVRRPEYAIK